MTQDRSEQLDGVGPEVSKAADAAGLHPVAPAVYNQFVGGVELVDVRVAAAELRARTAPAARRLRPDVRLEAIGYSNTDSQINIGHRLSFIGYYEDDGAEAIRVTVELEATYHTAHRMDDSIYSEFQRVNLPLNTWPYFREFLHSMLVRAGWPPFVLPPFRFAPGASPESVSLDQPASEHQAE